MVFGGVRNGIDLVVDSLRIFRRYPKLVVPLSFAWAVLALSLAAGFGFALVYTLAVSVSCSILLEMVEHVERGGTPSIRTALRDTVVENLVRMAPLILVWSILWFVLTLVELLFEDDDPEGGGEYSAESAARTLAGGGGTTSLVGLSVDALKKGVRMIVFLTLPAIAWEERGFVAASKRGYEVFRDNVSAFIAGFSLTYLASAVLFLPVGVVFVLSDNGLLQLSSAQWYLVIGYTGVAWSLSLYLEQMFAADLFLWYKEWEQAVEAARKHGDSPPAMGDGPRPTLLDDVASLEERKLPGGESVPLRNSD